VDPLKAATSVRPSTDLLHDVAMENGAMIAVSDRRSAPEQARELVARLRDGDALGPRPIETRETHGSWVLLTDDRAFKIKKPVVLPFLDYGSLARRREMCLAEVEVNRRAAPATYLGVRAVVSRDGRLALAGADARGAIEYAVEMRRFAEDETLAARIARGEVTAAAIANVGEHLAAFHRDCRVVPDAANAEPVKRTVDDNFASLHSLLADDPASRERLVAAERFAAAFLGSRWTELEARGARGCVRDGHGDLRAEHVVLDRGLELVDAIEFDPELRRIDVGMDLAFLVMDLVAAGRTEHARTLVAAYRSAGGDPGDDSLIAFFAAYRAQVRAKVALLRQRQSIEPVAARSEADALLGLAERFAWAARQPFTLAVAGVAASGKTTLADALAKASGAPSISSDVVRKRMLGLKPSDRAPATAYTVEMNAETYREIGRLTAQEKDAVIADATFRARRDRDEFRAALGSASKDTVFVECRVPARVLEARARAREAAPVRVSDATADVVLRQLATFEPLDEVPAGGHLTVRSDQPVDGLVGEIAEALDRRRASAASPQR
jgi:aminoglycoside phosphotransferase family enzyme/predicted kinase